MMSMIHEHGKIDDEVLFSGVTETFFAIAVDLFTLLL